MLACRFQEPSKNAVLNVCTDAYLPMAGYMTDFFVARANSPRPVLPRESPAGNHRREALALIGKFQAQSFLQRASEHGERQLCSWGGIAGQFLDRTAGGLYPHAIPLDDCVPQDHICQMEKQGAVTFL